MNQTISNACGTIALIHALVNNSDSIDIGTGVLHTLVQKMLLKGSIDRAKVLEESNELFDLQHTSSVQGQTEVNNYIKMMIYRYLMLVMMLIYISFALYSIWEDFMNWMEEKKRQSITVNQLTFYRL